ncbi:MAG: HAD family hydrolase [Dehalococcoidia bacterium]
MAKGDAEPEGDIGAFFDIDGTVAASNLVDAYIDLRLHAVSISRKLLRLLRFAPKLPYYALLDTFSRARFNEAFFRNYRDVSMEELSFWAQDRAREFWALRIYPAALEEIEYHRKQGHRIVLVTGGLKPMAQPLADLVKADGCVAAEIESVDGRLTGSLPGGPLSGRVKAMETRRLAKDWGVDLRRSYAYADSYADREFLEGLGHPIAVNPDHRLRRIATSRGWEVRRWRRERREASPSAGAGSRRR